MGDLDDALEALEMMVGQYLIEFAPNDFGHSFMSAGEHASEVLARLRPDRWEETPTGVRLRDGVGLYRWERPNCPDCGTSRTKAENGDLSDNCDCLAQRVDALLAARIARDEDSTGEAGMSATSQTHVEGGAGAANAGAPNSWSEFMSTVSYCPGCGGVGCDECGGSGEDCYGRDEYLADDEVRDRYPVNPEGPDGG